MYMGSDQGHGNNFYGTNIEQRIKKDETVKCQNQLMHRRRYRIEEYIYHYPCSKRLQKSVLV